MATYTTIKYLCPHCKNKAGSMFGLPQSKLKYYGCTRRRCKYCKNTYLDRRIMEIAMYPKEDTFPRWYQFYVGWAVYDVTVLVFAFVIATQAKTASAGLVYLSLGLLLGGFVVQILTNLLMMDWRKKRWQEEYDNSRAFREEMDMAMRIRTHQFRP